MPRAKKPVSVKLYNVCSAVNRALVVIGVPFDVAIAERDRLDGEARAHLHMGVRVSHDVVSVDSGLVVQ